MNVATLAHSGASDRTNPFAARPGRPVADAQRQGLDRALPHHRGPAAELKARSCLIDGEVVCCDSQYRDSKLGYARQCHADHSGHRGRALGR
jgi:hypothetical protein